MEKLDRVASAFARVVESRHPRAPIARRAVHDTVASVSACVAVGAAGDYVITHAGPAGFKIYLHSFPRTKVSTAVSWSKLHLLSVAAHAFASRARIAEQIARAIYVRRRELCSQSSPLFFSTLRVPAIPHGRSEVAVISLSVFAKILLVGLHRKARALERVDVTARQKAEQVARANEAVRGFRVCALRAHIRLNLGLGDCLLSPSRGRRGLCGRLGLRTL